MSLIQGAQEPWLGPRFSSQQDDQMHTARTMQTEHKASQVWNTTSLDIFKKVWWDKHFALFAWFILSQVHSYLLRLVHCIQWWLLLLLDAFGSDWSPAREQHGFLQWERIKSVVIVIVVLGRFLSLMSLMAAGESALFCRISTDATLLDSTLAFPLTVSILSYSTWVFPMQN